MSRPQRRLRVAMIGLARFGVAQPYAGGMECHVAMLARALAARGHEVTVYAGPATAAVPPDLRVIPIVDREPDLTGQSRIDNSNPPGRAEAEWEGYRRVLDHIDASGVDVIHNASLHSVPVVEADRVRAPTLHALHTPPFPELATAHNVRRHRPRSRLHSSVVAVSSTLAAQWHPLRPGVVPNGIDTRIWSPGSNCAEPTGGAIWIGRIVPEKGPHLAIAAARRAGVPIILAGPVHDRAYYQKIVAPMLGADAVHIGHLPAEELVERCRSSEVGVVTPRWEEPFGLVAVEMLATGLPVAGFRRGALGSIVGTSVGHLVPPDDVESLATAIVDARSVDRSRCRDYIVERFSIDAMVDAYLDHYASMSPSVEAGRATTRPLRRPVGRWLLAREQVGQAGDFEQVPLEGAGGADSTGSTYVAPVPDESENGADGRRVEERGPIQVDDQVDAVPRLADGVLEVLDRGQIELTRDRHDGDACGVDAEFDVETRDASIAHRIEPGSKALMTVRRLV